MLKEEVVGRRSRKVFFLVVENRKLVVNNIPIHFKKEY